MGDNLSARLPYFLAKYCRWIEVLPLTLPIEPASSRRSIRSGADAAVARTRLERWIYPLWIILIGGFALLHALHLGADFPNHSPWSFDFAKYTDEGWWGNAAIRAHLLGHWYVPGDFNPAAAAPVWPLLEWVLFFLTGVSVEAARGLAVALFVVNLGLSYLLLRVRGPRWMALFALTLLVTSPFLYSFSRLAILEPLLIALTLAALNVAVRLERFRHPEYAAIGIGLLFTLMLLTKTTAVFLLPAIGWALARTLWVRWRVALRCASAALVTSALSFGAWMALIVHLNLLTDYKYLFVINQYEKPGEVYWPLLSFWWSLRGTLWADRILVPLGGLVLLAATLAWRQDWGRRLWRDPVFGSSVLGATGYLLFMTYQNHPQPRYYAVFAFFAVFILVMGMEALRAGGASASLQRPARRDLTARAPMSTALLAALVAVLVNCLWTVGYATHPEYTFKQAAMALTRYVDQHPNGRRLLLSTSSDEITLISHLPAICDDFGTQDLVSKLKVYQPGWFATWNVVDPGTLEDLHNHYSLEQAESFRALDHPDRDVLVLFKLHPLPPGRDREPSGTNLQVALPGDKIDIPIE
jgi:hypothetical protein